MQIVHTQEALRAQVRAWRLAGERVGFVPTMGNLHAGHLALVEAARGLADRVVVSVFVNPMQFGPNEDFASYPRTLEADAGRLEAQGVHLLFAPAVEEIYPGPMEAGTRVMVPAVSDILEGHFRPGFFVGVATVVAKLFNLVQPDLAVFGEKDYQQLVVIRRMVAELKFPIEIIGLETKRESDGLAMSSRNQYLEPAERQRAPALYSELRRCADMLRQGERDFARLEAAAMDGLRSAGLRPDYVSIRRAADLAEPSSMETALVVLGAAWLGRARLIDNVRTS